MRRKCGPECVEIISGTNREKWDYVHGLYFPRPMVDPRDPADVARVADEAVLTGLFQGEESVWLSRYPTTPFEYWLQWKYERGTDSYGNLPQFKATEDVGSCTAPCPYSTQSEDQRSIDMLGAIPSGALTKVTHAVGGITYYMRAAYSGQWGYECTYDGCPYYLVNGHRYIYI
jgi:hypothetical protein